MGQYLLARDRPAKRAAVAGRPQEMKPGPKSYELEGLCPGAEACYLSGMRFPPFVLAEECPEKTRPWPQPPRARCHWLMWAPRRRPPNAKSAKDASTTPSVSKQDSEQEAPRKQPTQFPGSFATAHAPPLFMMTSSEPLAEKLN